MPQTVAETFLLSAQEVLGAARQKIQHCVQQLEEPQLWWRPTPAQNSIGNLILHLCGNLRQWVIAGIGPADDDRHRSSEFSDQVRISKTEALAQLDTCVDEALATIAAASPDVLQSELRIQGFDVTGLAAVFDSVSHFQGHTQEIISLTRQQLGDNYRLFWAPSTPEEGA